VRIEIIRIERVEDDLLRVDWSEFDDSTESFEDYGHFLPDDWHPLAIVAAIAEGAVVDAVERTV